MLKDTTDQEPDLAGPKKKRFYLKPKSEPESGELWLDAKIFEKMKGIGGHRGAEHSTLNKYLELAAVALSDTPRKKSA